MSSSTIYVYFENKDDMLKKTYLFVKQKMFESVNRAFDQDRPVRETIADIMRGLLNHLLENKSYFLFSEQFDNSPFIERLGLKSEVNSGIHLYHDYFDDAKEKGILKKADTALLIAYCYYPITFLAKENFTCGKPITDEVIEQAIELSWQAIKA